MVWFGPVSSQKASSWLRDFGNPEGTLLLSFLHPSPIFLGLGMNVGPHQCLFCVIEKLPTDRWSSTSIYEAHCVMEPFGSMSYRSESDVVCLPRPLVERGYACTHIYTIKYWICSVAAVTVDPGFRGFKQDKCILYHSGNPKSKQVSLT